MADFAAYTFYVNRPDLLERSLKSFSPALKGELAVLDNSEHGLPGVLTSASVFRPPVPFSYAQSVNWMLQDSEMRKVDFIIHFHSDAYTENSGAAEDLLRRVRAFKLMQKRWACAWTHYDLLWAINPVALKELGGWDTMFPTYFGDNDFRRRAMLAGWECIDTHIQGVKHEGSATINSDPKLKFLTSQIFPLHAQLYKQKWGGGPGQETFLQPWNGALNGKA